MRHPKLPQWLGAAVLFAMAAPLFALHVVATIPVGTGITAVAVNSKTNRIYVVNTTSGSLAVIDGSSNRLLVSIPVGQQPVALGINTITNRIYVVNETDDSITVVDGNTNTVTSTLTDIPGVSIAVNSLTNRIFVADTEANVVHVLSGSTNTVIANVTVTEPTGIAVNSTTNLVYGIGICTCGVFVIDGSSDQLLTPIAIPGTPTLFDGVAVDEKSNLLYVPSVLPGGMPEVSVVDAGSKSFLGAVAGVGTINGIAALPAMRQAVTTGGIDPVHRTIVLSDTSKFKVLRSLRVGRGPAGVAFNSATQFTYVTNSFDGTVSVISKN